MLIYDQIVGELFGQGLYFFYFFRVKLGCNLVLGFIFCIIFYYCIFVVVINVYCIFFFLFRF